MGLKDQKDDEDFGALPEFEPQDALPTADDLEVEIVEDGVGDEGESDADEGTDEGTDGDSEESAEAGDAADEGTEGATESDEDGEEAPHDAEYLSYSKNVRKRIDREVKLRKKEVNQVREQLQHVQQQSQQQIQTIAQREQAAQASLQTMQENYVTLLESSIAKDITTKQKELRAAKDEGDAEKEVAAMSELQTLLFQKNQAEEIKQQVAAKKAQPTQAPAAAVTPANPLAQRWVERNKQIFMNPKFRSKAVAIRVIDSDMAKEGWNPMTDSYYKELDRRIDEEFPGLRKKGPGKGLDKTGKQLNRSPVGAVNGGGGTQKPKSNVVRLTRADLENMKRYNLDPANKEHLKVYARQKLTA